MTKVALIALDGCYASSLTGFMDLLQIANAHAEKQLQGALEPFEWTILSMNGEPVQAQGGLLLAANAGLERDETFDLIYIPGVYYGGTEAFTTFLQAHKPVVDWLTQQWHTHNTPLAANCTGTFLLAETGLLNGRKATTTWWLEKQFRHRYPHVKLDINQLISEDNGLICAGSITSHQHLAIRMIERFLSPAVASLCAKALLVDIGQTVQAPYLSLSNNKDHGDKLIAKAQYQLQQTFREKVSIQALAEDLSVSQRTLTRRFKTALDVLPSTYLQNLRLEAAKHLLETTGINIHSLIHEVGYDDASSFSRLFQGRTGLTPKAYRERFKRTN